MQKKSCTVEEISSEHEQKQQQSSTSLSNLLEINNYLRRQKERLNEEMKSLSVKYEISQQKQKTLEGDVDIHRKTALVYERQIENLKQKLEQCASTSIGERSIELIIDENKRFRDEIESLTADNTKLGEEIQKQEEEIAGLKASLNMSTLKGESLSGNIDCYKVKCFFLK